MEELFCFQNLPSNHLYDLFLISDKKVGTYLNWNSRKAKAKFDYKVVFIFEFYNLVFLLNMSYDSFKPSFFHIYNKTGLVEPVGKQHYQIY